MKRESFSLFSQKPKCRGRENKPLLNGQSEEPSAEDVGEDEDVRALRQTIKEVKTAYQAKCLALDKLIQQKAEANQIHRLIPSYWFTYPGLNCFKAALGPSVATDFDAFQKCVIERNTLKKILLEVQEQLTTLVLQKAVLPKEPAQERAFLTKKM